ncbi:uncharacterized protein LOC135123544 [Zophobas morio]|uniref:uncharacterized protein LOC135123544 n=1 Tax=Zophobas morio TaxID=2755281 RepID=UPI003083EBF9
MGCFRSSIFLFTLFVPFVATVFTVTVFDLNTKFFEITQSLLETFNGVKGFHHSVDLTRRRLLSSLNKITHQIAEINMRINTTGRYESMTNRMLRNMPNVVRFELMLHYINTLQIYINIYYHEMENYVKNFDDYENATLLNFANRVLSETSNSVPYMMESMYQQVVKQDILQLFLKRLDITVSDYFCEEKQSAAQILHDFMNEILVTNMKSCIVIQTAYMIKKLYKNGNYKKESEDANHAFWARNKNIVSIMKTYMVNAPLELWRCDPEEHKKDETYLEITNFLHGIILNKVNLDPNGGCSRECDVFTYTTNYQCHDNKWCNQQTTCPKIINCHYIDSSMEVCTSESMIRTNRRYDNVKFGNGKHFGKSMTCSKSRTYLETYRSWLIFKCSYCYCLCEEGPKFFSERYINMRLVKSNITDNKVVTGLRFVKTHGIIHLQIQEGRILPHGQINIDSVRWIPVEDYNVINKTYEDDKDYYTLKWEQREFDLVDIFAKEGSVVTGVAFEKFNGRLHLNVLTNPYNFKTGSLGLNTTLQRGRVLYDKLKFSKELKLDRVDVPIRSEAHSNKFTTNKYVKFTNTGYEKDAGQTTVPFFDAQPVESAIPVPLSGVGVFHKGISGFGGFIAPRIFTYNFTKHLEGVINQMSKNDKL